MIGCNVQVRCFGTRQLGVPAISSTPCRREDCSQRSEPVIREPGNTSIEIDFNRMAAFFHLDDELRRFGIAILSKDFLNRRVLSILFNRLM